MRIAVAERVGPVDPLFAESRAERLVSRQIYEPLASTQNGPFEQSRRLPGIARSLQPGRDETQWIARLRPGVLFSNGEVLDADAVKANAERWMEVGAGPGVIPELNFVDSPRPGLVRFFLDGPDPDFDRTLGRPELGLVAPTAIASSGAGPVRRTDAGTGPFELRERNADRVLLARNGAWWGTPLGLGPGVDQIELLGSEESSLRADQLTSGQVQVADELEPEEAQLVARNPLLTAASDDGQVVGIERSVRGLDSAAADQSLSDVWLTDLR